MKNSFKNNAADAFPTINLKAGKTGYQRLFIKNNDKPANQCIVFLSGTSTQLADISYFLDCLVKKGYSVAAVERFIGGVFDVRRKPAIERKEALKHFIDHLTKNCHIKTIHIIAHSYASFEVIRFLTDVPDTYRQYIRNIIFINPAGFNDAIRFVPHCLRFTFLFIIREYFRGVFNLLKTSLKKTPERKFYLKKLHATNSLFLKTIRNPVRTFKEISDIVSFKIKPFMEILIDRYGYCFYLVVNTEDELISPLATMHQLAHVLPEKKIIAFPGNHMDLLIDKKQIRLFLNKLEEISGAAC